MTFFSVFHVSEKKVRKGQSSVTYCKRVKQHWQKCYKPFRDCKPDYLKRNFQRKLVPNSIKHENISAHFFEQPQNLCNPFAQAGAALWIIYNCCRAEYHWHGLLCQLFQRAQKHSRHVLLWGNHNSVENALGNVAFAPADILASALPLAKFKH